jgi:hypothetical protein
MKKRKIRELLHGSPMEWPKNMSMEMHRVIGKLHADAVVSVVCEWENAADASQARATLSAARRQSQQREHSVTFISKIQFVVKASLRFIQCLFAQANLRALNIQNQYQFSFAD